MEASKEVVIVGDSSCGKTSLIISLNDKYFFGEEDIPEVLKQDCFIDIKVKGIKTSVCICDPETGKKFE